MSLAAAERQDALVREMAERGIKFDASKPFSWRDLADAPSKSAPPETSSLANASAARIAPSDLTDVT